jgi:hypothetical protein
MLLKENSLIRKSIDASFELVQFVPKKLRQSGRIFSVFHACLEGAEARSSSVLYQYFKIPAA